MKEWAHTRTHTHFMSHFGENRQKEKDVLLLIGFDSGKTQLPADRTVVAQVSGLPAAAASPLAAHRDEAGSSNRQDV